MKITSGRSRLPNKAVGCLILACVLTLAFSHTARAQQQIVMKANQPQNEIANLERDVTSLLALQKQLIEQVNELKQLLPLNGVRSVATPPVTLSVLGEPFRGDSAASVGIIEYADFECPYCGQYARQIYPHILERYINTGRVKYFYRDLPLSMHPHAMAAARAARCAGEQGKYWEIHDDLFSNQSALGLKDISTRAQRLGIDGTKLSECLASDRYSELIRKSMSEAQNLGIEGTPTFFIGTIDGDTLKVEKAIKGASSFEVFKSFLDALLAPNGQ